MTVSVAGIDIDFEDYPLSGAFTPDGTAIEGGRVTGTYDARVMDDLVGGDTCALLGAVGVSCQPCSNGSGNYCVSNEVDSMTAVDSGLDLFVVTEADTDAFYYAGICDGSSGGLACATMSIGLGGGPIGVLVVMGLLGWRRRE